MIVCCECAAVAVPRRRPGPKGDPRGGPMLTGKDGRVQWECPYHPDAETVAE